MIKKGIVSVVACVVAVILLILTGAFISSVVNEKSFSDRDKFLVQAVHLAEGGLHHGIEELRQTMVIDLNNAVGTHRNNTVFLSYIDNNIDTDDSLDFLCDFLGFSYVSGRDNEVELSFNSNALPAGLPLRSLGSFTGRMIVRKQKDATGNEIEGYSPNANDPNVFVFPYEFSIEVTGNASLTQETLRMSGQTFEVTVQRANFARFALFTNHHRSPRGFTVWFTGDTRFYGPVHTNQRFSFALNPSGYFAAEVTQHLTKARFYNNGRSRLLDADNNGAIDVPTFNGGFQRGVDVLNLESAVSQNDLKTQALGGMSEPGSNGIYIPNDGANTIGGVYIKGDSNISLGLESGNAKYTIVQGSGVSRVTKEVIVDYGNNQTQVKEYNYQDSLVNDDTYSGLPDGVDNEGVIIYDKGDISSLSGTVQRDSQVTISSQDDIIISGHIRYEQYDTSPNTNANNYTNLLGILSWGGDIRVGTSTPSNLDVHAIVMAIHGVFTVDNYRRRSPSGNVSLLGGVITDFYGPFGTFSGNRQVSGYGRNFIYDERMLGAMSPPYYPTSRYFAASAPLLEQDIVNMSLIWQDRE